MAARDDDGGGRLHLIGGDERPPTSVPVVGGGPLSIATSRWSTVVTDAPRLASHAAALPPTGAGQPGAAPVATVEGLGLDVRPRRTPCGPIAYGDPKCAVRSGWAMVPAVRAMCEAGLIAIADRPSQKISAISARATILPATKPRVCYRSLC
ncbi:MAG: hypothetical protein ACE367_12115 [Acidimicrobiales bacterium]